MWNIEKFAIIFLRSEVDTAPRLDTITEIAIREVKIGSNSSVELAITKIAANENFRPNTASEIDPGQAAST